MIYTDKHETLTQVAIEVPFMEDVSELVAELKTDLAKTTGIGLAANQVGSLKRVILMNCNGFMGIVINPVIEKYSGKTKVSKEGCLSFPNTPHKNMRRDNQVVVTGFDENWQPIKKKCKALTAFCIQHEIDHLNGLTIKNNSI